VSGLRTRWACSPLNQSQKTGTALSRRPEEGQDDRVSFKSGQTMLAAARNRSRSGALRRSARNADRLLRVLVPGFVLEVQWSRLPDALSLDCRFLGFAEGLLRRTITQGLTPCGKMRAFSSPNSGTKQHGSSPVKRQQARATLMRGNGGGRRLR
jgi:hypothetical protein